MKVVFLEIAEAEHLEQLQYYETCLPGLGKRYLDEVEKAVGRIAANPKQFPVYIEPDIQKCVLLLFPFTLYFRILPEFILIAAVANQRRHPNYWQNRL